MTVRWRDRSNIQPAKGWSTQESYHRQLGLNVNFVSLLLFSGTYLCGELFQARKTRRTKKTTVGLRRACRAAVRVCCLVAVRALSGLVGQHLGLSGRNRFTDVCRRRRAVVDGGGCGGRCGIGGVSRPGSWWLALAGEDTGGGWRQRTTTGVGSAAWCGV